MFEISIKSHFCGAHSLNGYKGLCANLHGHNWEVEVFLRGATLDHLGMLVDFKDVKKTLQAVLEKLDHHHLNTLPIFRKTNPTAENIAKFIFNELSRKIVNHVRLHRVRVSESPGSAATYCKNNWQ